MLQDVKSRQFSADCVCNLQSMIAVWNHDAIAFIFLHFFPLSNIFPRSVNDKALLSLISS